MNCEPLFPQKNGSPKSCKGGRSLSRAKPKPIREPAPKEKIAVEQVKANRKKNKKAKHFRHENGPSKSVTLKTSATFPQAPEQFSSNWAQLQEMMTNDKTEKKSPNSQRKRKTTDGIKKPSSSPKFLKGQNPRHERILPDGSPKTIWFDDVDPELLEKPSSSCENRHPNITPTADNSNSKTSKKLTSALAIDCEMVGVGEDAQDSILARVSLVNISGHCVYDKFVAPTEEVTDYRTSVSGVRACDLEEGQSFQTVQKEVSDLLQGRILVGHALHNDLKVLFLSHPRHKTRDTSIYRPFRNLFGGATPSLKRLADKLLNTRIQEGEHDSVDDARVTMRIYLMYKKKWENELRTVKKRFNRKPVSPGSSKLSKLKI